MTLTTLSSKDFRSLFKWAFKRNRTITILYSIFLALGPILDMYVIASETAYYNSVAYTSSSITKVDYINEFSQEICVVTFVCYAFLTALFVLISAIKTFSFLHNKRSVDMYGALPTNRTTLFVSHLCAGVTAISAPYIIAAIIVLGITARTGVCFSIGLTSILSTILMIIASFIFTALMAYCCGTMVDTLITTLGINGIWIAAVVMAFGFTEVLIPGTMLTSVYSSPIITAFAPYGFGVMGIFSFSEGTGVLYGSEYGYYDLTFFLSSTIWSVIYIVGFFILTLFVANKRKAESSQNGFAVKWLPNVIKAGVSVIVGALIGFLFAESSSAGFGNMYIYAFWYAIMSFVAFAVLHVIFARGKGKILQSLIVYVATTVVSISLIFGLCYGLGIDTYVPAPETIKAVSIDGQTLKEPENIKLVTEIHQVIADGIRNENEYPYYFGYSSNYNYDSSYIYTEEYGDIETAQVDEKGLTYEDYERMYPYINPFFFNITYDRKVGFNTERMYYIDSSDARYEYYDCEKLNSLIQQLVSSEEYKKCRAEILFNEEMRERETITTASIGHYNLSKADNDYYTVGSTFMNTNDSFINGLYEVLKKDILADKEYVPNYYSGSFTDIFGDSYYIIQIEVVTHENPKKPGYDFHNFYVKESYTNTLDYLNQNFITILPSYDLSNYNSSSYYGDFYSFTDTGNYYFLESIVKSNCGSWASVICNSNDIDYDEWVEDNYNDYEDALVTKCNELYIQMQEKHGYGEGSGGLLYEYAYYIPTEEEAEDLVKQLMTYAVEYIEKSVGISSDTDKTDTDNSSDSDTAADSNNNSSDTDVESKSTDTNTESKTSDIDNASNV